MRVRRRARRRNRKRRRPRRRSRRRRRGRRFGRGGQQQARDGRALARPTRPPASDSSTLSTTSCRASRHREQPSAARTASSGWRAAPRARTSPATFTHAIVSSSATAPSNIHSRARAVRSCQPAAASRAPRMSSSLAVVRLDRRGNALSSACACSSVAPGRIRPTTLR